MGERETLETLISLFGRSRTTGFGNLRVRSPSCKGTARSLEEEFLLLLGFSKPLIAGWAERAKVNGSTIEEELLHDPFIDHSAYFGALAKLLALPFTDSVDARAVAEEDAIDVQLRQPAIVRLNRIEQAALFAIVPDIARVLSLHAAFREKPQLRRSFVITTPRALRSAIWQVGAARRVRKASDALFDSAPELSARTVAWAGQGFVAGTLLTLLVAALLSFPAVTLDFLHFSLSASFLILVGLRGLAISRGRRATAFGVLATPEQLPVYTVLVALYREEAVVRQLVTALDRLQWPASRLDIKLVCEDDDHETIAALKALNLPYRYEIVEVPLSIPRTKPKALNYALEAARGEFLVIYDAEDQPHPDQLLEAYQRFRDGPPELACLQAPLLIGNAHESWISALFALEYAGLFRRLLPFLSRAHHPMPLGGTSNHFRVDILREVGGWDPYNVTEDADLGMRLQRLGYFTETIGRHTLEAAPTERTVWLPQRTRWFKGWMQTWLVMMRQPIRTARQLGWRRWAMFHVLVTGMLVSALAHPFILFFAGLFVWHLFSASHASAWQVALFAVDCINIVAAYTLFVRLGYEAMTPAERRRMPAVWRYVPQYWMLISLAAWKAVVELRRKPFFWNKTPHRPRAVTLTVEEPQ